MSVSTLRLVQELKNNNQDFEFYPTTADQIKTVVSDIKSLKGRFDFTGRYRETVKLLDIGAGDGRVLQAIKESFSEDEYFKIDPYAIEKAPIHTATYREKGITLLGTEFSQVNFISKNCTIAFVNPPYSDFNYWLSTLISHLAFGVLYAIVPERWADCPAIAEAIKIRGIKQTKVLAKDDFLAADRQARAKVEIIRFSFQNLDEDAQENARFRGRNYKPSVDQQGTDPFQLFIENELGLKKTYSSTNEKFSEYEQRERIRKAMETEGSESYELVKTKGVLWALLDNYEIDLANTLEQYKLISQIDPNLLQELGVDYDGMRKGAKEKMFGYRNVYWSLLFDKLDAISNRLTTKHRQQLLKTLSSNALDFTYTNALYIVQYAVAYANELIEQSLIDVFQNLTSKDAISRYYVSNQHVVKDDWRYNETQKKAKYLLDYRFIHSNWSNFGSNSYEKGLNEGARHFTNDLIVVFMLLGYSNVYANTGYEYVGYGDKVSIMGTTPTGDVIELLKIRFYKNGNRHLSFNQEAMLRFNVTVSRVLGWVRCKEDFATETEAKRTVSDAIWAISDDMKVTTASVPLLVSKVA
ncbi:DUF4942 domain-containing protein [Thalassotalea marina]|uniref:DUF4942 domain-containing protein n=1 Tax=Thalassotalea marina TaxID=1673741 RepID=A0A919BRC9_9GAMM|nr:DUF4942 domain-containing protein [Thalassotalea marina]GHG07270.1 hypothetical protein GCM10017161_41260 [Thalassotalea marina]